MIFDRINIRWICRSVICFLLGRAYIINMNPAAVAALIILYSDRKKDKLMPLAVIIGIISSVLPWLGSYDGGNGVRYILIWMCVLCIDGMAYKRGFVFDRKVLMILGAAVSFLIDMGGGIVDIASALPLAAAEALLIVIMVNLMYRGMEWFGYGLPGSAMSGDVMISVIICLTLAACGLPDSIGGVVPARGMAIDSILLYMSCQYGMSAGALTGAAAGILVGIETGNPSVAGMYCIVGICVGVVRELGRIFCVIMFLAAGFVIAVIYPEQLWNIDELKNVISSSILIMLLPSMFFNVHDGEEGLKDDMEQYNYQYETSKKLQDFSRALLKVGECFNKQVRMVPVINAASTKDIFAGVTETVCGTCDNCNYCWGQLYYDTYHNTLNMLESVENEGRISPGNISVDFVKRCTHFEAFVYETNRQLELSRINADMRNRQAQTRLMIAEQMNEVAGLIERLEKEIISTDSVYFENEDKLRDMLKAAGVKLDRVRIYEKKNGAVYVYISARTTGNLVTVRKIGEILSGVMGHAYKETDDMPVYLDNETSMLTYVKDVKYRVITGTARTAKAGENISGDNYSFIKLRAGKFIMMITDGMGSGYNAYHESETVIEMLEQLLGAGFSEKMALRFVNNTMLFAGREDMFSTVDMCVIDLNSGMCECIKCGAASTYIKRKNGVIVAGNDSVPLGIIPEMNYSGTSYRLSDGDYVIMISDGIEDSFNPEEVENEICRLIGDSTTVNTAEMAEYILESARNSNIYGAVDDMSVIVAEVIDKN